MDGDLNTLKNDLHDAQTSISLAMIKHGELNRGAEFASKASSAILDLEEALRFVTKALSKVKLV